VVLGDQFCPLVGVEQCRCSRKAIDDACDPLLCLVDEASGSMEDPPAQRLGSGVNPGSVHSEELEPPPKVDRHGNEHQPVGVYLIAGEGEPHESRVLQATDVLFHVGVGPHGHIQFGRVSVLDGVEAPGTEAESGEEAALGPGVEGCP
jgi:hypothetical protein